MKFGVFEILIPLLWPLLPYSIRYRLTLLIENFRTRAKIEIPDSKVQIFSGSKEIKEFFPNSIDLPSEIRVNSNLDFSLVVSCKGEKDTIDDFLKSIALQSHRPSELIICDAGGEDEVRDCVYSWSEANQDVSVNYFVEKNINIAVARNLGVGKARQNIIAFADLGTKLDINWAKNLLLPMSDSSIDCSMGWYKVAGDAPWQVQIKRFLVPQLRQMDLKKFLPSTRSLAIRKTAFEKVGGFLENLTLAAEDSLFGYAMKVKGVSLAFSPDAIVEWKLPDRILPMWRKIFNYSRGDAETGFLFWKHYFDLFSEFFKALVEISILLFVFLIFEFLYTISWCHFFVLAFLLVAVRAFFYFKRFGALGENPFFRILALSILSSAQLSGFIRGLLSLRSNKELLNLYKHDFT